MVNKILPLGNRILVHPQKKQERTTGGLIIPTTVNKDLEEGIVISTGELIINVKNGDRVLYQSRSGIPVLVEDITYKFLTGPTATDTGEIIAII